jgi:hypothetical protein
MHQRISGHACAAARTPGGAIAPGHAVWRSSGWPPRLPLLRALPRPACGVAVFAAAGSSATAPPPLVAAVRPPPQGEAPGRQLLPPAGAAGGERVPRCPDL